MPGGQSCDQQKENNDVYGFFRARVEYLFEHMWHWSIIRNVFRVFGTYLHEYVRVLLHLQQFLSWCGLSLSAFSGCVSGALRGGGGLVKQ